MFEAQHKREKHLIQHNNKNARLRGLDQPRHIRSGPCSELRLRHLAKPHFDSPFQHHSHPHPLGRGDGLPVVVVRRRRWRFGGVSGGVGHGTKNPNPETWTRAVVD